MRKLIPLLILGVLITRPASAPAQRGCATDNAETWEITVAGDDEPGEALVVEGVVSDASGGPVAGAVVYVYQADARGYYAPPGQDASVARLCGHMLTGDDGRYRLHTIRPASYPNSTIPAHIHFVVSGDGIETETFELEFRDDPFVTETHAPRDLRRHEGLDTAFHRVQSVTRDDSGVLKCKRHLRVTTHR